SRPRTSLTGAILRLSAAVHAGRYLVFVDIIRSVQWTDDGLAVRIVDQRELPARFVQRDLRTLDEVCDANRTLAVRGAPAIGIAVAMGLVVALARVRHDSAQELRTAVRGLSQTICATRPTAVNLPWALSRMQRCAESAAGDSSTILKALRAEATDILEEDRA